MFGEGRATHEKHDTAASVGEGAGYAGEGDARRADAVDEQDLRPVLWAKLVDPNRAVL
jgi:hypothetical protein